MTKVQFPIPTQEDPSLCRSKYLEQISGNLLQENEVHQTTSDDYYFRTSQKASVIHGPPKAVQSMGMPILKVGTIKKELPKLSRRDSFSKYENYRLSDTEKMFLYNYYYRRATVDTANYPVKGVLRMASFYHSIKDKSLYMVFNVLQHQLTTNLHSLPGDIADVPHRLFSWSFKDFFKRREVRSMTYLNVLKRKFTPQKLLNLKLKCDIAELITFVKFFYDEVRREPRFSKNSILEVLWEAHHFTNVEQLLQIPVQVNTERRDGLIQSLFAARFGRIIEKTNKHRKGLEDRCLDESEQLPIEYRYMMRAIHLQKAQEEIKYFPKYLENQLKDLQQKIIAEQVTFHSCMNMYYELVEYYKTSISRLSLKFDADYENIEMEVNMSRHSLNKNIEDLSYRIDQVKMFRRRIAEVEEQNRIERIKQHEGLMVRMEAQKALLEKIKAKMAGNIVDQQAQEPKSNQRKIQKEPPPKNLKVKLKK